jgi:peptidoglycan/LPS O-acetylase OafA/YrhL
MGTVTETRTPARNRDLWLDTLRTLAIIRVVTYHTFGGSWLTWVFPSMGVMFALAGGLMVRSLDRSGPKVVIKNRFRRLLPAFWLYGAVMVSLMLAHGWTHDQDSPLHYWQLLLYVLPVLNPPSSTWGANYAVILWYLRTYLWFVALSPLLLKAFRRWPIVTLAAPMLLIYPGTWALDRVYQMPDNFISQFGSLSLDLVVVVGTYASCWVLGMAHREGYLKKIKTQTYTGIVVLLAVIGIAVALKFPNSDPGAAHDLDGLPFAQSFWSMAFVMALLRVSPDVSWLARTPLLGKLVVLVNARAVTIYLWHNFAIDMAPYIDDRVDLIPFMDKYGIAESVWFQYLVAWVLVGVAILLFGWVEDIAARRKPRLFPWESPGGGKPAAEPAVQTPEPVRVPDEFAPAGGYAPAGAEFGATGGMPPRQGYPADAYAGRNEYDDPRYRSRAYDERRYDDRSYDNRGHDNRGHDNRGYDRRGHDNRGHDNRGYDNRGYDDRGYDNRREYEDPRPYPTGTYGPANQDREYRNRDEGQARVYRSEPADPPYPEPYVEPPIDQRGRHRG